jgi:hypothetical protein
VISLDGDRETEGPTGLRGELDRRFQRDGRLRLRRFSVGLLVGSIVLVAGFQVYVQVEYGTLAWWSAPPRIS